MDSGCVVVGKLSSSFNLPICLSFEMINLLNLPVSFLSLLFHNALPLISFEYKDTFRLLLDGKTTVSNR
jgi:hypothetical protein